jgi:hypothetical protein
MQEIQNELIDKPLRPLRPRRRGIRSDASALFKSQRLIHRCLCLLIFILIFEGVARKFFHQAANAIFFLKDIVTILLLILCISGIKNPDVKKILNSMGLLLVLLFPCIVLTAYHDSVLAVFGLKQYLLFPTVAVAMCAAYLPNHWRPLFSLFRWIAFSVIVTTLVAVAQNKLPAANWLNLSVGGDDMSMFSAGGYLRVSSTFPFFAQYCFYLNALCYCLPALFGFNKLFGNRAQTIQMIVLIGLAITGTFVTGSRGAVIGNATILCIGGLLAIVCCRESAVTKIFIPVVTGIVLLCLTQFYFPEFFSAYEARVEGSSEKTHSIEIEKRVKSSLLDWTQGSTEAPPSFLGYGLGVMSNGSDKLSAYAAKWRGDGFWTETDQATTFFEGGWYLIFVWYGFRLWVIAHTLASIFKIRRLDFRLMACFAWGFIFIIGIIGNLGIQPPLAIWWWLAVGLITCLGRFDQRQVVKKAIS